MHVQGIGGSPGITGAKGDMGPPGVPGFQGKTVKVMLLKDTFTCYQSSLTTGISILMEPG